jgi:hypothetical protein
LSSLVKAFFALQVSPSAHLQWVTKIFAAVSPISAPSAAIPMQVQALLEAIALLKFIIFYHLGIIMHRCVKVILTYNALSFNSCLAKIIIILAKPIDKQPFQIYNG